MWEGLDILVTTDPELLDNVPEGKNVIKLNRPYNGQSQDGLIKSLLQIHDLDGNPEFEKLINYVAPPEVEDTSVKVEYNNPKIKLL